MGRHWCYVLKCEDERIYVGETISLYNRFNQHLFAKNTKCTAVFQPHTLIALYDVCKNAAFMEYCYDNDFNKFIKNFDKQRTDGKYSNLDVENEITEHFMYNNSSFWWKVNGGKYTNLIYEKLQNNVKKLENVKLSYDSKYSWKNREAFIKNNKKFEMTNLCHRKKPLPNHVNKRPLCDCGYLCEIDVKGQKIFFICPLKNAIKWFNYKNFAINIPCEYSKYYEKVSPVTASPVKGFVNNKTKNGQIKPGTMIYNGDKIVSGDKSHMLIMQDDGNLVLYNNTNPLWSSKTHGVGVKPFYFTLQNGGNMIIKDGGGVVTWSSNTIGKTPTLMVQNDGNLVLYDGDINYIGNSVVGNSLWSTDTYIGKNELKWPIKDLFKMITRSLN